MSALPDTLNALPPWMRGVAGALLGLVIGSFLLEKKEQRS